MSSAKTWDQEVTATRPWLALATVSLSPQDQRAARRLGRLLFRWLNRPVKDPLAYGPGIPVAINVRGFAHHPGANRNSVFEAASHEAEFAGEDIHPLADNILAAVVVGRDDLLIDNRRSIDRIERLFSDARFNPDVDKDNSLASSNIRKVLVPTDPRWIARAELLSGIEVLNIAYTEDDGESTGEQLLIQLQAFLANISTPRTSAVATSQARPRLLVSQVGRDERTDRWRGSNLEESASSAIIKDYFDRIDPLFEQSSVVSVGNEKSSGNDHEASIDTVAALLVGDQPGSTRLVSRGRISAEARGWPVIEAGPKSDQRDWIRRAAIAHLQHLHFMQSSTRLAKNVGLPKSAILLPRQPELHDFARGVMGRRPSGVLLHPEPSLTPEHRELLRGAAPRLRPVTPSTLLGRGRTAGDDAVSPLDTMQIGLSVSSVPRTYQKRGQTDWHLQDAVVQITRSLVDAGAGIAYGGRFVLDGDFSFTVMLAELIEAYNRTVSRPADRLSAFQAAGSELDDIPTSVDCSVRHAERSPDLAAKTRLKPNGTNGSTDLLPGMADNEMRWLMNQEIDARVLIGGKPLPKRDENDITGYFGRHPGLGIEMWLALEQDRPVYVCGGFGGLSEHLADLWLNPQNAVDDDVWNDKLHEDHKRFADLVWQYDRHPMTPVLGLPKSIRSMAQTIADRAETYATDDDRWIEFNGLSYTENRRLWRTTDPIIAAALIGAGLTRWQRKRIQADHKVRIEAIHGGIGDVPPTDVIAVPVFEDVPPQGAGVAIDAATDGAVGRLQGSIRTVSNEKANFNEPALPVLASVHDATVDAQAIAVVSLGRITSDSMESDDWLHRIQKQTERLIHQCENEKYRSLALVTFGGSAGDQFDQVCSAMLRGMRGTKLLIRWVELDRTRFDRLVRTLKSAENQVQLTTLLQPQPTDVKVGYPTAQVLVNLRGDELHTTLLPQNGQAVTISQPTEVTKAMIEDLGRGIGRDGRTPSLEELERRGHQLFDWMLGEHAETLAEISPDTAISITHDEAASIIPFELLRWPTRTKAASVTGGVHRTLALSGGKFHRTIAEASSRLKIGLIINPTGDPRLSSADREGEMVEAVLNQLGDSIRLSVLRSTGEPEDIANRSNVLEMIQRVDVLHYCGHAAFDATDKRGYLILNGHAELDGDDLSNSPAVPSVVILNACEAARVRNDAQDAPTRQAEQTYSLAETFLRSGVNSLLGTYWPVLDDAAGIFAQHLYVSLTQGEDLRASLLKARQTLHDQNHQDWANYILYGDGRFRLV